MTGAFSRTRGDVCGSGGRLNTGEKSPNFCLAAWKSAALLDCVSPLPRSALPSPLTLPPLPKQAEDHPLSPQPEAHGGCSQAWLGVGWQDVGQHAQPSPRHLGLEELCIELAVPHDAHFPPPISPQVRCCCSQFSISRMRTKSNVLSARVE